ncbi:MAG TPA: hypothetical protein VMX17_05795 [Candidatus Glassbacteria bacterium]|nr:hypothetical protein [Candidatus Glassbacteria bacterium]
MEDYFVRENAGLLRKVKTIFGEDIVRNAWFINYTASRPDLAEKYLDEMEVEEAKNPDESLIHIDAIEVVIEFSNGNKVQFETSEWGSISSVGVL